MSGFLLVPTALAMFGKRKSESNISWKEILLPDFSVDKYIYSSYGIGLTLLLITVLILGLTYKKWEDKLLTIECLLVFVFPVFTWLLNGGLYLRCKVWIPFLPICCYLIAVYLKKQKTEKISFKITLTGYLFTLLYVIYEIHKNAQTWRMKEYGQLLILEAGVGILIFLLSQIHFLKKWKIFLLTVPSICFLIVFQTVVVEQKDDLLSKEFYAQVTNPKIGEEVKQVLDSDDGLYRVEQRGNARDEAANINRVWDIRQNLTSIYSSVYNDAYHEFRKNVFQVEELFRNDLMQATSENPLY